MRIAFLIPTVETFGSVREMIEISNVLVKRGHQVFIFHPQGHKPRWLPCAAHCLKLDELPAANLDVLIGIVDWQPQLYDLLLESKATLKAICLMGFEPSEQFAAILRGEAEPRDKADRMIRHAISSGYLILGDGGWQMDWVRDNVGIEPGPAFGGINLQMFSANGRKAHEASAPWRILYSGDKRERKGTDTVKDALSLMQTKGTTLHTSDWYYGKCVEQDKLIAFLRGGDIFLDGHRRAGWCNPVIEAMACGNAVVCTDIGAVQDFAIDGETALVVPVDDADAMANAALRLIQDNELRRRLVYNGLARAQRFDYNVVAPRLAAYFEERL